MLLMDNFDKYPELRCNCGAAEHPVLDIIYRRVKKVFSIAPEPADYETALEEMKSRLR